MRIRSAEFSFSMNASSKCSISRNCRHAGSRRVPLVVPTALLPALIPLLVVLAARLAAPVALAAEGELAEGDSIDM